MKRIATLLCCMAGIGCLLAVPLLVFAPKSVSAEGAQAFSISPPLLELAADPGANVKATIKFTNVSDDTLSIKMQVNDFGPKNETGEPNIIFEDIENAAYSLRRWIVTPAPFTVKPHESKTVDFPIAVPQTAEPGGHYAVIRFTGTTPELEESGVALTASIGTLVFLQVSGDIQEKASFADMFSAQTKRQKTGFVAGEPAGFFESGPVSFVERIRNEGNVHLKPTGTIEISNLFGRTVGTLRVNGNPVDPKNPPRSVLPSSIRRFEQTLDKKWLFGRYTAKAKLSYGQGQQPLEQTITFWVIPYKLIVLTMVAVAALFFALRWTIKRYNAYIIRNARSGAGRTHRKR